MNLSVVICTYNEEKNLERAVRSVKDIADEIVVVDAESTDKTVELAKKLGCKVYHHKHIGIIEPMRNYAISKASGDLILLLDADEEVSPNLSSEIISLKSSPQADYYRIPRQNLIFGQWIKSDHWWPDYTYRLFKKGSILWKNQIHSLPQITGKGKDLENFITHHNYQTITQYLKKLDVYTDFQSQDKIVAGYKFHWSDLLLKPASEFIAQYFARHGYQNGIHGLALSLLQAFSELIVYLKIWQSQKFSPQNIHPSQLTGITRQAFQEFTWWQFETRIESASPIIQIFYKIKRKLHLCG